MAKNVLPVDFQDDILTEDMDGRRRYQMITNADGTVSFVDVTEYTQVGSNFGQAQINATNEAVNESADKNKIIDSKEDLLANTQAGMMAGALAVKEIRSELNENLTEYVSMKYVSTGDSDVHIKFKIIDTSQLRAYITALITSQSGQPVMLTVSINIENNTIKSWNQITPINNSFGIQSVNIEEGGIQVKFNSVGVWGVCQYWGTGISI